MYHKSHSHIPPMTSLQVTPTPDAMATTSGHWEHQQPPNSTNMSMTRTLAHYQRHEQIGQGTYGQVYRATSLDTNHIVALKKMRIHHGSYWGMPQQLIREIKILKRLRHVNILRLHEVVTSKGVEYLDPPESTTATGSTSGGGAEKSGGGGEAYDGVVAEHYNPTTKNHKPQRDSTFDVRESYKGNLFLVLEYVPHDLTGLMDVAYQFSPLQVKIIFMQLLEAVAYMHEQKYIHRDIKSSNILLDDNLRLKLADFGLARCIEPPILDQIQDRTTSSLDMTNKVITLWYRPPEILLGAVQYGPPVDIFSSGCMLAELLLGKPLFCGKSEMEQLQLLVDMLGTPSLETWQYLQSLKKAKGSIVSSSDNFPTIDMSQPKQSRLRTKYEHKISPVALNLLEKLLDWDPRKRLTAANALTHRYFWSEPAVPANPAEWGRIHVPGGHFHEFQTKKKRRQAKAQAEKAKEEALLKGLSEEEAKTAQDEKYLSLMKMVAEVGFDAFDKNGQTPAEREKKSPLRGSSGTSSSHHRDGRERKRHGSRSRSSRDDDVRDGRRRHSGERKKRETSEERRQRKKEEKEARTRPRDYDYVDAPQMSPGMTTAPSKATEVPPRTMDREPLSSQEGDGARTHLHTSMERFDDDRPFEDVIHESGGAHATYQSSSSHYHDRLPVYDGGRAIPADAIRPTMSEVAQRWIRPSQGADDRDHGRVNNRESMPAHDRPLDYPQRPFESRYTDATRESWQRDNRLHPVADGRGRSERSSSASRRHRSEAKEGRGVYSETSYRDKTERPAYGIGDRQDRDDRKSSRSDRDRDRNRDRKRADDRSDRYRDGDRRRHELPYRSLFEQSGSRPRVRDPIGDAGRPVERSDFERDGISREQQRPRDDGYYGRSSQADEPRRRGDHDRRRGGSHGHRDHSRHMERDRDHGRSRAGDGGSRGGSRHR